MAIEDKDVIRIHHADTPDQAKARHERVLERLNQIGPSDVRAMQARDALPQAWAPIIAAWLRSKEVGSQHGD